MRKGSCTRQGLPRRRVKEEKRDGEGVGTGRKIGWSRENWVAMRC